MIIAKKSYSKATVSSSNMEQDTSNGNMAKEEITPFTTPVSC